MWALDATAIVAGQLKREPGIRRSPVHESVPSREDYRAHSTFLPRLLRVAALGFVALSMIGVIVAMSAELWLEAIFLGGPAIPVLWWSSRYRVSEPESLSRRLSYKRRNSTPPLR